MKLPTPELDNPDFFHAYSLLSETEKAKLLAIRPALEPFAQRVRQCWDAESFPAELLPVLRDLGLSGMQLDGASLLFKGLAYVELARFDVSLSALVGIHNELSLGMIDALGSVEQKKRWLPPLSSFDALGAFSLTEPDHGSDVAGGLATTATYGDGGWVLQGAKRWIGAGTIAHVALVWARQAGPAPDTAEGEVLAFLVPTTTTGFAATKIGNKIGLRVMQNADIALNDVRVNESDRLPKARGFAQANPLLRDSRAWVGWQCAGIQMAALDVATGYARTREQFGRPLAKFQLVQQQLAEMAGNAAATLALMLQVAREQKAERLTMPQAAMAKSTGSRLARASVAMCRAILGGNGIVSDFGAARLFGDAEVLFTYEGSYEINSLIVGRGLTGVGAFV